MNSQTSKDGNENSLPGFFLKLLRWYCNSEKLEEIEGDLEEIFYDQIESHGIKKAKWLFVWNVVRCCKPYAWKRKIEFSTYYINIMMLFNYFKTARRNLVKHKTFSAINILGLSFSMSVCLLIITIINDQLSHDNFHKNKDRIYRVITDIKSKSKPKNFMYATTAMPVADALKNDYSGVEDAVRITKSLRGDCKVDDKIIGVKGIFADQSFFTVFGFELKYGDARTALKEPYTVLLSENTAYKFFANENPIGKIMEIGDKGSYTITGIIKDPPAKSHIKFELIGSASTIQILEENGTIHDKVVDKWDNAWSTYVYVLLEEGVEHETINTYLSEISAQHANISENHVSSYTLQKLSAITPSTLMNNAFSQALPIEAVLFLAFLALIVMLSACFNYTNLSISRALTRAKEVGIRKVSGAMRWQVITQFLSESILFSIISLVFALFLYKYFLVGFNQMYIAQEISMHFDENISTYLWFLGFSVIVGIIAGLTPAIFLSSFQPISVLKNLSGVKFFSKINLRKSLIVLQFTLSLFFIITALIIHKQSGLLINSEYGFAKENIINIKLKDANAEQYLNEIKKRTDVIQASASSHIPATLTNRSEGIRRNVEDEQIRMGYFSVDHNYIDNLNLTLLAGRNFPDNMSAKNENFIILNEKATKELNFESVHDAIGEQIYLGKKDSTMVQIIGVVEDYSYRMLLMDMKPMGLRYKPGQFQYANVKIKGDAPEVTIAGLETEWKKLDKNHAFDFQFFEAQLEDTYGFVKDLRSIISVTAILTIIIASLGLLGMAIYNVESRSKEVGIRKVMGADITNIIVQLSKGFLLLIALSILIATPLAYFANNLWLQEIATRITVGPAILTTGILILLGIGALTVGSQSVRAAFANPANSLKDE